MAWGFDVTLAAIVESKADVVVFQEVKDPENVWHNRMKYSLAQVGLCFVGWGVVGDMGLLSRWPITSSTIILEPRAERISKGGFIAAYHIEFANSQAVCVCVVNLNFLHYSLYLPRGYSGNDWTKLDKPITENAQLLAMEEASERGNVLRTLVAYTSRLQVPVIIAGSFNEASHLDWTDETAHLYGHNGVVIQWKNSMMLHEAGFRDSWREVHPSPVSHPGHTWPSVTTCNTKTCRTDDADERDRIDFIYHSDTFSAMQAWIVGTPLYSHCSVAAGVSSNDSVLSADQPWASDHKGVVVQFNVSGLHAAPFVKCDIASSAYTSNINLLSECSGAASTFGPASILASSAWPRLFAYLALLGVTLVA